MAAVIFTDREMQRAWQANLQASINSTPSNAHRLLLFYAIECGLKAVLMKRRAMTCTNHCREFTEVQHDINKLLDILSAGQALKLPSQFNMSPVNYRGSKYDRRLSPGKINQMWRYGGKVIEKLDDSGMTSRFTDEDIEQHLIKISQWIEGELRR
ncbi:MAG: hypothetical protein ACKO24_08970 [Leptolyngbyaceae cyanobacterium]